jgi:hypothetical protein
LLLADRALLADCPRCAQQQAVGTDCLRVESEIHSLSVQMPISVMSLHGLRIRTIKGFPIYFVQKAR